jgi:hypothetical protein
VRREPPALPPRTPPFTANLILAESGPDVPEAANILSAAIAAEILIAFFSPAILPSVSCYRWDNADRAASQTVETRGSSSVSNDAVSGVPAKE